VLRKASTMKTAHNLKFHFITNWFIQKMVTVQQFLSYSIVNERNNHKRGSTDHYSFEILQCCQHLTSCNVSKRLSRNAVGNTAKCQSKNLMFSTNPVVLLSFIISPLAIWGIFLWYSSQKIFLSHNIYFANPTEIFSIT
jgi:hypothetical protein